MATHDEVLQSFETLAGALCTLEDKVTDPGQKARVSSIAATVSDVTESFDAADPGSTSDSFDAPVAAATSATVKATTATGNPGTATIDAAVSAADRAQLSLQAVTPKAAAPRGLVGMLRVAPSAASFVADVPAPADQSYGLGGQKAAAPKPAAKQDPAKPYIASLILLFPTEAVTLFPIGQNIAAGDGGAVALVVLVVALFVVTLRYFGTKDPATGIPAWNEIGVALLSFLLWVGSIGGYEAKTHIVALSLFDPATMRSLFGFVIIMWVSIVPFLVAKAPAAPGKKRKAAKKSPA